MTMDMDVIKLMWRTPTDQDASRFYVIGYKRDEENIFVLSDGEWVKIPPLGILPPPTFQLGGANGKLLVEALTPHPVPERFFHDESEIGAHRAGRRD